MKNIKKSHSIFVALGIVILLIAIFVKFNLLNKGNNSEIPGNSILENNKKNINNSIEEKTIDIGLKEGKLDKQEKDFKLFMENIKATEITKNDFVSGISNLENIFYYFINKDKEDFNNEVFRKDDCLIFNRPYGDVSKLCDKYIPGTETNDIYRYFNQTYADKYQIISAFGYEWMYNIFLDKELNRIFKLSPGFARIDNVFIENLKFNELDEPFIKFFNIEKGESKKYYLGYDICEVYNLEDTIYISLYKIDVKKYKCSSNLDNLKYIKLNLSKIDEFQKK